MQLRFRSCLPPLPLIKYIPLEFICPHFPLKKCLDHPPFLSPPHYIGNIFLATPSPHPPLIFFLDPPLHTTFLATPPLYISSSTIPHPPLVFLGHPSPPLIPLSWPPSPTLYHNFLAPNPHPFFLFFFLATPLPPLYFYHGHPPRPSIIFLVPPAIPLHFS